MAFDMLLPRRADAETAALDWNQDMNKLKSALKVSLGALAIFFACGLTACNTIEGMGEDIEEGGEEIQDAAE